MNALKVRGKKMNTKKVKITALMGGMEALNSLMRSRLTSWQKSRELARFYEDVVKEAEAVAAEVQKLHREFPDRSASPGGAGEEYARRAAIIDNGEVELDVPTLGEADFLSPSDMPSPADMFLLKDIVDFT